jgi:hypothetical protein
VLHPTGDGNLTLDEGVHLLTWSDKLIPEMMVTEGDKRERQDDEAPAFLAATLGAY